MACWRSFGGAPCAEAISSAEGATVGSARLAGPELLGEVSDKASNRSGAAASRLVSGFPRSKSLRNVERIEAWSNGYWDPAGGRTMLPAGIHGEIRTAGTRTP